MSEKTKTKNGNGKLSLNERQMLINAFTLRRELIQKLLDDTRDLNLECGYPDVITIDDYNAVYGRNGIGSRVVELMPEECWNVVPEIAENDEEKETDFEKAWKELEKKFHLFNYLQRIDTLSGVGQFGILLIGVSDGKQLNEPVDGKKLELTYLRPFTEYVISVKEKEKEVSSARYGLPTMYSVKTENLDGTLAATTTDIHWTRVIHVADNREISETFGTPRMKRVYNYLLDLKKLLGGSAEMFWKGGFPGYAFEVDKERKKALTTTEKTAIREEMLNFSNKLQRYITLVGITAKSLTPQVADPKMHFEVQLKAISITLGVPYRVFMGTEEAKLASGQDVKMWNRRVKKRQEGYLTPMLVTPFIDRFIELGILPTPKEYFVRWPEIDEVDPKDAATIAKDKTEALSKYVVSGAEEIMSPFQFLTTVMGYDDEEVKAMLEEVEDYLKDFEPEEPPEPKPKPEEDDE